MLQQHNRIVITHNNKLQLPTHKNIKSLTQYILGHNEFGPLKHDYF